MADVYTYTFILIGMLLSLPALLVGLNLLMPNVTQRVQTRRSKTQGKSFLFGVPVTAAFALWIAVTANANWGPLRAAAIIAAFVYAGLGTLGAAGMARLLGQRLGSIAHPNSELTHLLRGAVVYEFACLFPIVGWFLFAPLVGITAVGAATFALLKWLPRPVVSNQLPVISIEQADLH
jgi:hypothetical protein